MTDILPWLIANWLAIVVGFALCLAFLLACLPWAAGWYMRRVILLTIDPQREPEPSADAFGDYPKVPEEAKRRAA